MATYNGDVNNSPVNTACGDPAEMSIVTAAPPAQLVTTATPTAFVGQPISDTATLSGGSNPTGTITFIVYGPDDALCVAPAFQSTVPVAGNGDYASAPFTPTSAGTYRWVATYSGDATNPPVSTACADPAEMSTVTAAPPAQLVTTATPTAFVGQPISDTATLLGGSNPTGTITFIVYGPDDALCVAPAFQSTVPVAGNGDYASAPFTPTSAGTYRWVATYSGDATNPPVSTACADPAEVSIVTAAPPTTTTTTTAPPGTTTTTTAPPGTTTTTTAPPATTTTTAPPATTTTTAPPATTTTTAPPATTTTTAPPATTTTAPPGTTTTTSTAPPGSTTTTTNGVPGSTTTTAPPGTGPTANANPSQVVAGEQVTVFGANFPPNTPLDVTMFSDPVRLGSTVSDAAGGYSVTVTIPANTSPGAHDIVVTGGGARASTRITVLGKGAGVANQGILARTGTNPGSLLWLALLGVVIGATFLSYPGGNRGPSGPVRAGGAVRRRRGRKPAPRRAMP